MKQGKSISVRLKRTKSPKNQVVLLSEWIGDSRSAIQSTIELIDNKTFSTEASGLIQTKRLLLQLDKKFNALHSIFDILRSPYSSNAFKNILMQSDVVRINGKEATFSLEMETHNTVEKGVIIGELLFSAEELISAKRVDKVWYVLKGHVEYSIECLKLMKI